MPSLFLERSGGRGVHENSGWDGSVSDRQANAAGMRKFPTLFLGPGAVDD
jgi:hypothetical protein